MAKKKKQELVPIEAEVILDEVDGVANSNDADQEDWDSVDHLELSHDDLLPAPIAESDSEIHKALERLDKLDPLTSYLREISKYDLLSLEQEKILIDSLIKTGDIEVAKKLVLANLRLVVKIAMEYRRSYSNVMDLIQEGNIGLMKAVSKYDPTKGAKLSYYASWWIRSYILRFILDNFRLVKVGTTQEQKRLFYHLMKEKQRLESLGITPGAKILSENLGVSEKSVVEMDQRLSSAGQELSLDFEYPSSGDKGLKLLDIIPSETDHMEDDFENKHDLKMMVDHLAGFLDTLKPRDKEIFQKRLLNEVPLSLQAIADEYGVSRERIRQVEERLISQLRVYMAEFLR